MTVVQRATKRLLDVILASVLLLALAPVLLLAAGAIKLTSPGPVFFVQSRAGRGGKPFAILKFRSMRPDTVVEPGHETLGTDPRITTVGHFLRRSSIDELPQLLNVLGGSMSLVGPRPLLQWEIDLCNERQAKRLDVKPGLTGLAQINGRNAIPWAERIEWDVRYVEQASVSMDLAILLKTVPAVLGGGGAFVDDVPGNRVSNDSTESSLAIEPAISIL